MGAAVIGIHCLAIIISPLSFSPVGEMQITPLAVFPSEFAPLAFSFAALTGHYYLSLPYGGG